MQVVGSFFWLSLEVTLNLGKIVSFAPSSGTPLTPKGSSLVLPEIFKITTFYPEGRKEIEDDVLGEVDQPMLFK